MFRFSNPSENLPFYHDKLFTLEWELDDHKWLLIRYVNSQRKRWYRSTERPYRFRRWFFRRSQGKFSNLANVHSPKIELYLFRWYLAWPRKVVIPLRVVRMESLGPVPLFAPPKVETVTPTMTSGLGPFLPVLPVIETAPATPPAASFGLQVVSPQPPGSIRCDWPVSDWLENGLIDKDRIDFETLQQLNKTTSYAS